MNYRYNFHLLGVFRVDIDGTTINLKEQLGNQLSSLLGFLLCNHKQILSKEKIIDTFWIDSDNPSNALKYAIFRLRNTLKKISYFEVVDLVSTVNNGYQFNNDIDFSLDVEEYEELIFKAKKNNDFFAYKKAIGMYEGKFLDGVEADWIDTDRSYFHSTFLTACNSLAIHYIDTSRPKEAILICEKGLVEDEFDEQLIFSYLKALVLDKQYNKAMSYYQSANKKYKDKLGFSLESSGGKDFKAILAGGGQTSDSEQKYNSDFEGGDTSPMIVDPSIFNAICVYEMNNSKRSQTYSYVLTLTINVSKRNYKQVMERLLSSFEASFRRGDVISVNSENTMNLLFRFKSVEDVKAIEKRALSCFTKEFNSLGSLSFLWKKL